MPSEQQPPSHEASADIAGDAEVVQSVSLATSRFSAPLGSPAALRQTLTDLFDDGELRTLCFDLGIGYDDLPGQSKADKARELVAYVNRHGRLADLLATCRELRPKAAWPVVAPPARLRDIPRAQALASLAIILLLMAGSFAGGHRLGAEPVAQLASPESGAPAPGPTAGPPTNVVSGAGTCPAPEAGRPAPAPPAPEGDGALIIHFEDISGMWAVDSSGRGNHGWLHGSFGEGADQRAGHDGAGLYLDGASTVCVPNSDSLSPRNELEIALWARPAVIDNKTRNLVAKLGLHAPSSYRLYLKNGYPTFTLDGPTGGATAASTIQLERGRWHRIEVRYDGATLQLAVDGQTTSVEYRGTIQQSDAWLEIGSTPYRNEFFIGEIDEVEIRGR